MPEQVLRRAWEEYGHSLAMRTDFGLTDLPLLSMIAKICPEVRLYFVNPDHYPARHLRFRDQMARLLGLEVETCRKEPKALDRSALLQSDLAVSEAVVHEGRNPLIRPLAGWTLEDVRHYLKEHRLPQPADFVCLPNRRALADWLGPRLQGSERLTARPLQGPPALTRHRVFRIAQALSGPMGKDLGLACFDGQSIAALEDVVALGHLFAREGKPVDSYADKEIAQLVNLVACPRGPLESVLSVNALKRAGCRWDEAQAAAVSAGFKPLQRGPGARLCWTILLWSPLMPAPTGEVAVQRLQWEGFQLTLEPPHVLSPGLYRSVPGLFV